MKYCIISLIVLLNLSSHAQQIEWQKCLGGSGGDFAQSIIQTSDGGFILAGDVSSNDGDVTGNQGSADIWVVKLDGTGNIIWQKSLGGSNADYAKSIYPTSDGGYVVAGSTNSNNGDVSGNNGSSDFWVLKLDSVGVLQWQKCMGGTNLDYGQSAQQTTDGGYIVAGSARSNNGDVTGQHGMHDCWIVKLDQTSNIQWQKCFGGLLNDMAYSIKQTTDGGFIFAGTTYSFDGDVSGLNGGADGWIVKLDSVGDLQWQQCLGGTSTENITSVQQTSDGGYVVSGISYSNDGDVTGNQGAGDFWVIKLDTTGNIQWQKCLGGTQTEFAYSTQQTADGGYVVAGKTRSSDGDVTGHIGNNDYWVVKLDGAGDLQWQKCFGGTGNDEAKSIHQTTDGGYILAGFTQSNDVDVSGNHGNWDCWIVKITDLTSLEELSSITEYSISPNPFTDEAIIHFNHKFTNSTFMLYDIQGQKIKVIEAFSGSSIIINRENLNSGVYFFEMRENSMKNLKGKMIIY